MASNRLKAPAASSVPQSKTDCAAYIKNLGDVQRDFERQRADMIVSGVEDFSITPFSVEVEAA